MPAKTKIEWADYVSNPLKAMYGSKRGWACVKVSPGCANCWASKFNVRLGTGFGMQYTAQNIKKVDTYFDEKELNRMEKFSPRGDFKHGRSRAVAFPCDMTDMFGSWVSDEQLDKIFHAMSVNQSVDWFVLTKRPERMAQYLQGKTPLSHIYMGVSIEDQERANSRVYPMRIVRDLGWKVIVSYEPALHNVHWSDWYFIDWLVCGGESGSAARPMHPDWARSARDFCKANSIPFFFKQNGEFAPRDAFVVTDASRFKHKPLVFSNTVLFRVGKGLAGRLLDGRAWNEMPK